MVTCGCLFCENCCNQILKIKNAFCPNCKKQIDFSKSINLKNPNQVKQISFIFLDPEKEIKKMMKALKYQKIQQKKYINFLENKIDNLLKENTKLNYELGCEINREDELKGEIIILNNQYKILLNELNNEEKKNKRIPRYY